jgi:hypothetical protein
MLEIFESVCYALLQSKSKASALPIFDPLEHLSDEFDDTVAVARSLNAASLIQLCGRRHPAYDRARNILAKGVQFSKWAVVAKFYLTGINRIHKEIEHACNTDREFFRRLKHLSEWLSHNQDKSDESELTERIWSVFSRKQADCGLIPKAPLMHSGKSV